MFRAYQIRQRAISMFAIMVVGVLGVSTPGTAPAAPLSIVPQQISLVGEEAGHTAVKASPLIPPTDKKGLEVYRAARKHQGAKILVSTENRWLWFVVGKDTLVSAPVAIGTGDNFEFNGKKYKFSTPRGKRKVVKKEENPIWTVPAWHYYEKAAARGLEAVQVKDGEIYPLEDGTWIELRDGEVGRVNKFGNFWPFTPGIEIIFDGKIFMPPLDTPQRRVPEALGPYKLDTGDGYLIHGTHLYNEDSIGLPASHGCVRMRNEDLELLYAMVETGTPVFIF
jgi:hypothetical protein